MFIDKYFESKKPVLSFEIFPPKQDMPFDSIMSATQALSALQPDFISITYGAGGSTHRNTLEVAEMIKQRHNIDALAHLTCVTNTPEDIDNILDDLEQRGIYNILAMRGDLPDGAPEPPQPIFAKHLIEQIEKRKKFFIAAAAYPEGHTQANNLEEDVIHLGEKVSAGAKLLITQIFFDNNLLYNFQELLYKHNIKAHLSAGIMPVSNAKQILRIIKLCGASVPERLSKLLSRYGERPDLLEQAGVEYASRQIEDLIKNDIAGLHIYTMNKPNLASSIVKNVGLR